MQLVESILEGLEHHLQSIRQGSNPSTRALGRICCCIYGYRSCCCAGRRIRQDIHRAEALKGMLEPRR